MVGTLFATCLCNQTSFVVGCVLCSRVYSVISRFQNTSKYVDISWLHKHVAMCGPTIKHVSQKCLMHAYCVQKYNQTAQQESADLHDHRKLI